MKTAVLALGIVAAVAATAAQARAAMFEWHIALTVEQDGTPSIPPGAVNIPAGVATITYDSATTNFTWDLSYAGLTAPATAAHVHGPAPAGVNAPILINFIGSNPAAYGAGVDPASLPGVYGDVSGSALLSNVAAFEGRTVSQLETDLGSGLWYVNVHTSTNPGGEIRSQIPALAGSGIPEPASLGLLAFGGMALLRRR